MKKYDLTWGESVAVRQVFIEQTHGIPIQFGLKELSEMDYTPFNGDASLIAETAKVIKRQTGQTYKHIFLTNGASGGCTIALRAYRKLGKLEMVINPPPFFALYPLMAQSADLKIVTRDALGCPAKFSVVLLDTPANPSGKFMETPEWARTWTDWDSEIINEVPVIWDAVYHNWAYASFLAPAPKHEVQVGSYSKLTGLNGLRLGWIATNNDSLAEVIGSLVAPEYCGLSKPSKMILSALLTQFNEDPDYHWQAFEHAARYALDLNRENWSKLEKYFGNEPVAANGMFYYAPMDSAAKALMAKANVLFQTGSKCGTNDDFGRFNIGQDPKIVNQAVKAILKADKI